MAKDKKQTQNVLATVAVILVTVLLVTIPILTLGGNGPVDRVKKAVVNTLTANNFTMEFDMDIDGFDANGSINAAIDPASNRLDLFLTLTTRTAEYEGGIYNNTFVLRSGLDGSTVTMDITERIENFFALLDQSGTPDWSVLLDLSDVNLHKELSKDFDFNIFTTCANQWLEEMNNAGWAKRNAGYSKDTESGITTYLWQPDLHTLATQTAPMFESAFLKTERYQALQTYLDDAKYLLKDGTINLSFQTQKGYLSAADLTLKYNNTEMRCNIVFSNLGSTTVDTNALGIYIDEANQ